MKAKYLLSFSVAAALLCASAGRGLCAQTLSAGVVRLAELEIDPAQLDAYRAALREEIETSIRVEPGVLTLFAVAIKGRPNHVRLFEAYRDQAAYETHLQSPHFRKYKAGTQTMVKGLTLLETEPIALGLKR